ncbi:hypothetical protein ACFOU2_00150 [Bacillus songklensis]|uniref:Uncharacterized protein n=1 Tax=Bacillus songklensis TaxID=1069116 RepID=A0ABV8AYK2_9BACI
MVFAPEPKNQLQNRTAMDHAPVGNEQLMDPVIKMEMSHLLMNYVVAVWKLETLPMLR